MINVSVLKKTKPFRWHKMNKQRKTINDKMGEIFIAWVTNRKPASVICGF